jgi:predicted Zn-dependent protease
LIDLGRPRDALALCITALRSNPSPEARLVVAYALNQMHRPTEAIALLEGWSPKDSEGFVRSRHILADAYLAQNDLKRVAEIRTILSREFPNDWNTRIVVAKDAEIRGNFRDALTAYAALGGDLTTDLRSQIGQARVLIKDGRPIEALPYLERHLQREPWSVEGYWWLAKAHAMSGQFGNADAEYAKANAADPDHVVALQEWAAVLAKLGRQSDAKAKLALAVAEQQRLAVPIDIPAVSKP